MRTPCQPYCTERLAAERVPLGKPMIISIIFIVIVPKDVVGFLSVYSFCPCTAHFRYILQLVIRPFHWATVFETSCTDRFVCEVDSLYSSKMDFRMPVADISAFRQTLCAHSPDFFS